MNRFSKKKRFQLTRKIAARFSTLFFLVLLALFLFGVNNINETSVRKQKESLETALQRDIIHCYAVEGTYPPSLDYMKEHYGLTYNEELFFVDYQPVASNILPSVTVIQRSPDAKE